MNKRFFNAIPVAFALLALASCSNEDLLGGKTHQDGKMELVATVEAPYSEDGSMRTAMLPSGAGVIWQNGDKFRVYNEALNAFDTFVRSDEGIFAQSTTPNIKDVADYKKVITPGETSKIPYAGFDEASGKPTATIYVENNLECGEPVLDGDNVGYVSVVPRWGDAEVSAEGKLSTTMKAMTAIAEVTVYSTAVKEIRIVALKADKKGSDISSVKSESNNGDDLEAIESNTYTYVDAATPLSGYFEAPLEDGAVLAYNGSTPLAKEAKHYISVVAGIPATADETHVFIPIVAGTYKKLVVQWTADGNTWTDVKTFEADKEFKRNTIYKTGLEIGKAPVSGRAFSIDDLNKALERDEANLTDGKTINISITSDEEHNNILTGSAAVLETKGGNDPYPNTELKLPTTSAGSYTLNIKGSINMNLDNQKFTISGGTSGSTVKLNIENGISGAQAIEIKTACNLVLENEWTTSNSNGIKLLSDATGQLTLGDGVGGYFTTESPITIAKTGATVTVDAGTGSVASIIPGISTALTVVSGKLGSAGTSQAKIGGEVKIEGGEVGSVVAGDVTVVVKGGTVETLENGANVVNISGDAVVTNLTTKGTRSTSPSGQDGEITEAEASVVVKEGATVGTLKLNQDSGNAYIRLAGGNNSNGAVAKIGTLNMNKKLVKVYSEGKAVLGSAIDPNTSTAPTFNSKWTHKNNAVNDITDGKIYTAAQLGAITTGNNYVLETNVYASGVDWTSKDLNGTFEPAKDGKTIKGLNAPLFKNVTGTVGKLDVRTGNALANYPLTITGTTISSDKADQGALAQVTNNATVLNVIVADAKIEAQAKKTAAKNYGGLVGRATGTLTLKDIKVSTVSGGTIKAQANIGGYVGNFAGTEFNATVTNYDVTNAYAGIVVFGTTNGKEGSVEVAAEYGTVGYFIGSITTTSGTAVINIEKTYNNDKTKEVGGEIGHYFNFNQSNFSSLDFEKNTNGSLKYKGIQSGKNEIGYSTAENIDLNLYSAYTKLNEPDWKHADYINYFE